MEGIVFDLSSPLSFLNKKDFNQTVFNKIINS